MLHDSLDMKYPSRSAETESRLVVTRRQKGKGVRERRLHVSGEFCCGRNWRGLVVAQHGECAKCR